MNDRWAAAYVGSMIGVAAAGIGLLSSLETEHRPYPTYLDVPFGAGPGFLIAIGVAVVLGVGCSFLAGRSRPSGARGVATAAWVVSTALFSVVVVAAAIGAIDTQGLLRVGYVAWLIGLALGSASAWIRLTVVPRLLRRWPDPLPPAESALLDAWPASGRGRAQGRPGNHLPT